MRPILFFLAVFGSLLLVLYLVVGRNPGQPPGDSRIEAPTPASTSIPEGRRKVERQGNFIDLPFYDVEKGRLAYIFKGRLDDNVFQDIPDIQDLRQITLSDGVIEIPLYDDVTREMVAVDRKRASKFLLKFATAEYRVVQKDRLREEVEILLGGGGEGIADDGTIIHFEDMIFRIERAVRSSYKLESRKPISIRNPLLTIESPAGMEGAIEENVGLQRLVFAPPVRTTIDTRAAQLFSVDLPEPKAAGNRDDPGGDRLAITCEGPLTLDLTTEPRRIEFQKDVRLFEVPSNPAGQALEIGDTWFHCQKLIVEVADGGQGLNLSSAAATWEGGRVKAQHLGFQMEGDSLVWKNLGPLGEGTGKIRSEAVLTGRPKIKGERLEAEAETAVFKLDEMRLLLQRGIEGTFRLDADMLRGAEPRGRRGKPAGKEGEGDRTALPVDGGGAGGGGAGRPEADEPRVPQLWTFRADEAEILFDQESSAGEGRTSKSEPGKEGSAGAGADEAAGGRKPAAGRGRTAGGRRGASALGPVSRFIARADTDDGLIIDSAENRPGIEPFRLQGRTLTYDGKERRVTIEGGEQIQPRLIHGKSQGTSGRFLLFLDEQFLRLDRDVVLRLYRQADGSGTGSAPAENGSAAPAQALAQGLEISSDQLDVYLDEDNRVRSAAARRLPEGKPVTLRPLGGEDTFLAQGPALLWDHRLETAVMEAGEGALPRLGFRGGELEARKIRFDRQGWIAELEGGVKIRSATRSPSSVQAPDPGILPASGGKSGDDPVEIQCARAEVEFFKNLEAMGAEDPGPFANLRRVRRIHARGEPDAKIEISSPAYSGSAGEATWESESRALRLFGEGLQEFRVKTAEGEYLLRSEEITYRRGEGVIQLRRNVTGRIHQVDPRDRVDREARAIHSISPPAADKEREPAPGGDGPLVWNFSTQTLDVMTRDLPGGAGLELLSLAARDGIVLVGEKNGLELHGDDLDYDHARQEARVFSRVGRYQTLTHTRVVGESGGEEKKKTDKIDAREIRVWLLSDPALIGTGQAARRHVVVKFYDDVTATFYAPLRSDLLPAGNRGGLEEEWKLRTDYLGLRIIPAHEQNRMVQFAYAEGDVDFTSGEVRAMARQAIFEEEGSRLTLRGDANHPARLYYGRQPIDDEEIVLTQLGSKIRIEHKGRSRERSLPADLSR